MTVREVVENDLRSLLELYMQLHSNAMPEDSPALSRLWNDILQDKNHHIIVALENETIASSCVLVIVPNLTHGQRPYALIENVVTSHNYRTACLGYAKEIAQRHNCYKIMLMTGSKQDSTLHFYHKAGYNAQDKTAFVQWL